MKLIIIAILILLYILYVHSEYNTSEFTICEKDKCVDYNVHSEFTDQEMAAKMFAKINYRIGVLKEFMHEKYRDRPTVEAAFDEGTLDMLKHLKLLKKNYRQENMHEISPYNGRGATSFTERKGEKMVICLRDSVGKLHDINTIMFVVLHEISHVMNDKWGHGKSFWSIFREVLISATESGIYTPVDYSKFPIEYCKYIKIDNNPLYIK